MCAAVNFDFVSSYHWCSFHPFLFFYFRTITAKTEKKGKASKISSPQDDGAVMVQSTRRCCRMSGGRGKPSNGALLCHQLAKALVDGDEEFKKVPQSQFDFDVEDDQQVDIAKAMIMRQTCVCPIGEPTLIGDATMMSKTIFTTLGYECRPVIACGTKGRADICKV